MEERPVLETHSTYNHVWWMETGVIGPPGPAVTPGQELERGAENVTTLHLLIMGRTVRLQPWSMKTALLMEIGGLGEIGELATHGLESISDLENVTILRH